MNRQEKIAAAKRRLKIQAAKERLEAQSGIPQEEPGLGMQALDYLGRGLDYAGGLTRTGLANVADTFTEDNKIGPEDFLNALKGKAPSSEEILGRFDIPEGASVDLPLIGNTSVRDVGGFALDVAADPLTYVSLGVGPLAKKGAKGALNIAGKGSKNAGKRIYKSGFKKIDEALEEVGKNRMFSDIALDKGWTGSTKNIKNKADAFADRIKEVRDKALEQLDRKGAKVDLKKVAKPLYEEADELSKLSGGAKEIGDELKNRIKSGFDDVGENTLQQANRSKTLLNESLPAKAFDEYGSLKGSYAKYKKSAAKNLKEGIENEANRMVPGRGNIIKNMNEELGSLLSAQNAMRKQVRSATTKNGLTSIDGILAMANPASLVTKKGADLAKTTAFRTLLGKGLMDAGESGVSDILMRNLLIDRQNPNQSPWRIE